MIADLKPPTAANTGDGNPIRFMRRMPAHRLSAGPRKLRRHSDNVLVWKIKKYRSDRAKIVMAGSQQD